MPLSSFVTFHADTRRILYADMSSGSVLNSEVRSTSAPEGDCVELIDTIQTKVRGLPKKRQQEVLDFVEFLLLRNQSDSVRALETRLARASGCGDGPVG